MRGWYAGRAKERRKARLGRAVRSAEPSKALPPRIGTAHVPYDVRIGPAFEGARRPSLLGTSVVPAGPPDRAPTQSSARRARKLPGEWTGSRPWKLSR